MASDKADKKERKEKKEKKDKDKKEKKASEVDGVKKSKSDKKEKKEKKEKKKSKEVTEALLTQLDGAKSSKANGARAANDDPDMEDLEGMDIDSIGDVPADALVPFANPLADDAQHKAVLNHVKTASKNKTLKRGVKEVVKALRKSPSTHPSSSNVSDPAGVVVIAADISPMDVISHLPVLCEDHNVPYIYLKSRAALGIASETKRATSVVMISKTRGPKGGDVNDPDYAKTYDSLVRLVRDASSTVVI